MHARHDPRKAIPTPASADATRQNTSATTCTTLASRQRARGVNAGLDYADLFENAPVGYMLMDADSGIRCINRTGASMLGWEPSWLADKPFTRWVVNNDRHLLEAHQRDAQCDMHCVLPELRIKNRQGRLINLRLESMRVRGSDAEPDHFRSAMIDISGEEQSARRLRRLQSQLAHVARLNTAGELATSLAHELNQPLGTIMLNCEAALRLLHDDSRGADELATALTQATEAAAFASQVIRHLRGFLRKSGEQRQRCRLPQIIHEVTRLIETEARDHDIELQLDIDANLPCVTVDPVQIEQVLVNLAHNSIEAMSEAGGGPHCLAISACQLAAGRIRVSVRDSGPGLDAAQLQRIFQPFYTTKQHGMGMGLAISRSIIEAHGGRLWANDANDRGVAIHFTLPGTAEAAHASA